jgi:hypothetical protein
MTKPETLDQLRARLSTEKCGLDTARLLDYIDRLETAVNYLPPRDQIRAVLLDCGYRIKEGQTDLADYVYKAAYVLLNMRRAGAGFPSRITPAMLTAAEEAYMPFGDMQAAIVAALAHAPESQEQPSSFEAWLATNPVAYITQKLAQNELMRQVWDASQAAALAHAQPLN